MKVARARPIVTRPTRARTVGAPPISLSLRWRIHRGADALDAQIAALRTLRTGTIRDRAIVAAAAIAEETANRPEAADVRAALAMLAGKYMVRQGPDAQRNIALIAAAAAAMEGRQVHLVQLSAANAAATARGFGPVAARLGLTLATLDEDADLDTRIAAYGSDVVIASANRLTRDLLRERITHGQRSRGVRAAISRLGARDANERLIWPDRVTGIVVDADLMFFESPRPVAVADEMDREKGRVLADQAFVLISEMQRDVHYFIDTTTRRVRLTDKGRSRIETYTTLFGDAWLDSDWCETTVLAAITVRDLFAPGSDYAVEGGGIQLTRGATRIADGPSIPDLIAAKEALPSKRGELHLADVRRLMASYAVLGATGHWVPGLEKGLAAGFRMEPAKARPSARRPIPAEFFRDQGDAATALKGRLARLGAPVTVWTPVAVDVAGPELAEPPVVGIDLFAAPPVTAHLFQLGAAPAHWEERLEHLAPGLRIERFLSATDPWFERLPAEAEARTAFAAKPNLTTYAAAQDAEAQLRHQKRMAALASDSFFDRILAFTGDMGW